MHFLKKFDTLLPMVTSKKERQENYTGFNPSVWWTLLLKVKSAISAPLAASNEIEQPWRDLSGVCPCKTDNKDANVLLCGC